MKTLVIGGTGTVGSQLVGELLARQVQVQVLTRSPDRLQRLPGEVESVIGDLQEPAAVRSIFKGVEAVFMLNAMSPTEAQEGLMAVSGIRNSKVKRLVYMSVHQADRAPHLPQFGAKLAIEAAVAGCGVPYTILRPNSFFQMDQAIKDAILQHGLYPQPFGEVGISRVDVRDIAEAAAVALTSREAVPGIYNLVGPDVLTGPACAEIWSRVLGRPVRYAGNDLDAWEKQALQWGPPWMAYDLRLMLEFMQEQGLAGTAEDQERLTRLLGHPPRRFEDFVRETAGQWGQLPH